MNLQWRLPWTIGDCRDNTFSITRSESAAGVCIIPIHSALRPIIAKLIGKRDDTAFLFPDFQDTGCDGNRTMALSKRFTYYRKKLSVHDKRPGARRSKVNFHKVKKWMIQHRNRGLGESSAGPDGY